MNHPPRIEYYGDIKKAASLKGKALGFCDFVIGSMYDVQSIQRYQTIGDAVIRVNVSTGAYGERNSVIQIYSPVIGGVVIGGIFCTVQDGLGCWIYTSSFNPIFKATWVAQDRWWFNKNTGLCVCADSGSPDKIDIGGTGYVVDAEDLLHCSIPKKGYVIGAVASNEHGTDYLGHGIKYLNIIAYRYVNSAIEVIEGKVVGEYYVPFHRRSDKGYIGGFSQDTKTLWLLDEKRDITQWVFIPDTEILNILDEYVLESKTTVLATVNSILLNYTYYAADYDHRDTTLVSSGNFIETAYVYEDVVTILTSSVTVLDDHSIRHISSFPYSGTSERETTLSIKKYESGILQTVKNLSGLNEAWSFSSDGTTATFSHTQKRTFILYMNASIDLYVIMTAEISGNIAELTEFPENQHINIKIIQGTNETTVFYGNTPFGIPAYDSAWLENFELPCPALINMGSSISSEVFDDTSLFIYEPDTVQSYDPMSNINQSAFDGKTVIICFYACYFTSHVFSDMPELANPRTLIINTKKNPIEYLFLDHRIDNPVVSKIGSTKSHSANAISITHLPK